MASRDIQHKKLQFKNREILERLNNNQLKFCNILTELTKKVDRLSNDLECVKSYINKLKDKKKIKHDISSGWFF